MGRAKQRAISIHIPQLGSTPLDIIIAWFPFRLISASEMFKSHARDAQTPFDVRRCRTGEASAVLNQLYCCLLNVKWRRMETSPSSAACGHVIFGCHHPQLTHRKMMEPKIVRWEFVVGLCAATCDNLFTCHLSRFPIRHWNIKTRKLWLMPCYSYLDFTFFRLLCCCENLLLFRSLRFLNRGRHGNAGGVEVIAAKLGSQFK